MTMKNEERAAGPKAMSDLPKRLRIKASMIALGERIPWGSDTAIMEEAAEVIEALSAAAPAHPAERQDQGEVQRLRDWVACVERLPADKRDVMVYCADSDEHMVGASLGDGLFLFATASHGEKVVCRPTHWRYIDESDKPAIAASTGQEVEK